MSDYVLKAKGVCKSFSGVHALKNVDFEIQKGEIHCLGGENGSGKSTLINIISGYYQMDSGEIELNGNTYKKISPQQAILEGVQVIYQDFAVFPNLTVKENIAISTLISGKSRLVDWKRIEKTAQTAMDLVGIHLDLDQPTGNISVADKQLVAICRAIVNDVKLLIMDEPTTALTKKEIANLFKTMLDLKKKGISILFVSHKLDEVFQVCDKYSIIRDGENVVSNMDNQLDEESFSYYMTGRRFASQAFEPEITSQVPAMKAENLGCGKYFEDVCFEVYPGEIIGFAGLLGSGRRELALSLFGVLPHTSGKLSIHGEQKHLTSVNEAISCGIGYVPEDRLTEGVFPEASISDNLLVLSIKKFSNWKGTLMEKKARIEVDRMVTQMQIKTKEPQNPVQTLSGGNQQKVVLGKWLLRDMNIMILNAPTVGVDIGSKYDIHAMLRDFARQGKSVIVVSDDISEIMSLTNRIYVMKNGKVSAVLKTAETTGRLLEDCISS